MLARMQRTESREQRQKPSIARVTGLKTSTARRVVPSLPLALTTAKSQTAKQAAVTMSCTASRLFRPCEDELDREGLFEGSRVPFSKTCMAGSVEALRWSMVADAGVREGNVSPDALRRGWSIDGL